MISSSTASLQMLGALSQVATPVADPLCLRHVAVFSNLSLWMVSVKVIKPGASSFSRDCPLLSWHRSGGCRDREGLGQNRPDCWMTCPKIPSRALADMNGDGRMDIYEFSIAMKLIKLKLQGHPLPPSLPPSMKQPPLAIPPQTGFGKNRQELNSVRFFFCLFVFN